MNWFRQNKAFWYPVLAGVIGLAIWIILLPKAETFLRLQLPHSKMLNLFFSISTWMGDGLCCILVVVLLAFLHSAGRSLLLLSGYLGSSFVVQLLKNTWFLSQPRPVKWLEINKIVFDLPDGLAPHLWNSFPSGHSATAITLFFVLATFSSSSRLKLFLGLLVLFVGYSRIYLFMHFPEDVLAGLFIGLITTVPIWAAWNKKLSRKPQSWLNKPLLKWGS